MLPPASADGEAVRTRMGVSKLPVELLAASEAAAAPEADATSDPNGAERARDNIMGATMSVDEAEVALPASINALSTVFFNLNISYFSSDLSFELLMLSKRLSFFHFSISEFATLPSAVHFYLQSH